MKSTRFDCDMCGDTKRPSNGWWVAMVGPVDDRLKIGPWNSLTATEEGAVHLCGAGCAHKLLDRFLATGKVTAG
jgi:hypothetical protein